MKDYLIWVDIETTGLIPKEGRILEVAMVITTGDLEWVARRESLVGPPLSPEEINNLDPVVWKMHRDSGLLHDTTSWHNTASIEDVDAQFASWLRIHTPGHDLILAGSTVRFDRAWIDEHMPQVQSLLHYRVADISCTREFLRRWMPNFEEQMGRVQQRKIHRALDDLHDSIRLAEFIKQKVSGAQS